MKKVIQETLAANQHASHVLFHDHMYAAFGDAPCNDLVRIGSAKDVSK